MSRRFLQPRWIAGHLLVLLAAAVCLRLGWWQWGRTHDRDGTIQNLGYAVLWPVFAGAFIYMWIRFLQLETARDAEEWDRAPGPTIEAIEQVASPTGSDVPPGAAIADRADGLGAPDAHQAAAHISDEAAEPADGPSVPGHKPRPHRRAPGTGIPAGRPARSSTPSRAVTVGSGDVGVEPDDGDDGGDDGLVAYNRALAALAEKDRRAR